MRKNIDAQPPHRSYEYTIAAGWPRISALGESMQGASLDLPTRYYLERDPDIMILRRPDGAMVGAFSARGAVSKSVRLQARFFGHFEVLYGDEVITLGRNGKALTILKYLLAHRSRPVSQDHLMGWLWPESNLKKRSEEHTSELQSRQYLVCRL